MITGDGGSKPDPSRVVTLRRCGRDYVLRFTHHAEMRMASRRASDDEIADCLAMPTARNEAVAGGSDSRRRWSRFDPDRRRTLHVVFEREEDGAYTIVSVFWKP